MDRAHSPEGLWLRVLPSDLLRSQQRPLGSGRRCAPRPCPAGPLCVLPAMDPVACLGETCGRYECQPWVWWPPRVSQHCIGLPL